MEMIIGIGSDIVDIDRIRKTIENQKDRFIERCFTEAEIEKAAKRAETKSDISTFAKRFAAKEACSKALGTGFNHGVYMKDISIMNNDDGNPYIELTGGAKKQLQNITPNGMSANIHLTMSDDPPIAQAFVVIEAIGR
jgi:holo-[acyl-carrier protein] synthase